MTQRLVSFHNPVGDGQVHIHALGCADTSKGYYKASIQTDDGSFEWTSKEAWGADHWLDINAEMEAEGQPLYDWQDSDLRWFPCVTLRDTETDTEEGTEMAEKTTKAEKKELPGKAPNEVPAPRSSKSKALPGGKCRCGCGRDVGKASTFAQGHDARFVSQLLVQIGDGKLTVDAARKEVATISEPLLNKLNKAIENADKAVEAKEQAARDKAAKAKTAAEAKEAAKKRAAEKAAAKKAADEANAKIEAEEKLSQSEDPVTSVEGDAEDERDGELEDDDDF